MKERKPRQEERDEKSEMHHVILKKRRQTRRGFACAESGGDRAETSLGRHRAKSAGVVTSDKIH
jgi:hypothetical protein